MRTLKTKETQIDLISADDIVAGAVSWTYKSNDVVTFKPNNQLPDGISVCAAEAITSHPLNGKVALVLGLPDDGKHHWEIIKVPEEYHPVLVLVEDVACKN